MRKGVHPYEYIDSWNRLNEIEPPSKEKFYRNLRMKSINDRDYEHGKIVWKALKIKNLGEYHDLYVQSDTLLLADVFEEFRKSCIRE